MLSLLCSVGQVIGMGQVIGAEQEDFFENRIRPLFVAKCYGCHADDMNGSLRLDSRTAMMKGGERGPAVSLEHPEKSLLLSAIRYENEKLQMPPTGKLKDEEIADVEKWIRGGMIWPDSSPVETTAGAASYQISDRQRQFWSFQPIRDVSPPEVDQPRWSWNPVDSFIYAKARQAGLEPAPKADKRTLIRRVYFDLTGLPPTPEEVQAFVDDDSTTAFASVVDALLASPRYGERWGRHWLDVVRYADTAGDASDYPIPQARLYRDYVIRAFNQDKPYDQFIREQIAGDLLPYENDDARWEHVIATGYLAISRRIGVNPKTVMHLTYDDTVDNLTKSLLGLSVGCARCHDHKYDPIPQSDYYALYGIFESTRYPFPGSEKKHKPDSFVYRLPTEQAEAILKPYYSIVDPLASRLGKVEGEKRKFVEGVSERSLAEILDEIKSIHEELEPLLSRSPDVEMAYAVAEDKPHDAAIFKRGEPNEKGAIAPRGFLQILGGQKLQQANTSGRLELANWIVEPSNPLAARVMVNRVWEKHFGRGLVTSLNDFGIRGQTPSHPELLDFLCREWVASGWSLKALHRMLVVSETYQLATIEHPANAAVDVNNVLLWRGNRQRLDAESIRDAWLMLCGDLEWGPGGEHPFPHVATWDFMQHGPFTAVYPSNRRSVYLMTQRIQRHPYLGLFDGPDPNVSTAEREATITPVQALFVMNSEFMQVTAERLAKRLLAQNKTPDAAVRRAYELVYARPAKASELAQAFTFLDTIEPTVAQSFPFAEDRQLQTLASFLRVLLASNEFLFVE